MPVRSIFHENFVGFPIRLKNPLMLFSTVGKLLRELKFLILPRKLYLKKNILFGDDAYIILDYMFRQSGCG
jgi:hypothetical protein